MWSGLVVRVIIVFVVASVSGCATPAAGPGTASSVRTVAKATSWPLTRASTPELSTIKIRASSPGEHIAFSLAVALERIETVGPGRDWRQQEPDVFWLGGMNKIVGLVIDRERSDIILVGHHDPDRPLLTLDDFVVALRARFVLNAWPLVSIDPTEETEVTNMQSVRMEGGIEDTQFGNDLLLADYTLKKLSFGLLDDRVSDFKNYVDHYEIYWNTYSIKSSHTTARFWFYPIISTVAVREDVVAAKGLKVGVFTELLAIEINGERIAVDKSSRDPAGDAFAEAVSARFEELSRAHPSFARTQSLFELLAVITGLEQILDPPALGFWLQKYYVTKVTTPRIIESLTLREIRKTDIHKTKFKLFCANIKNNKSGSSRNSPNFCQEVESSLQKEYVQSGGIRLRAIALRLRSGDPIALKDAVLATRPTVNDLAWAFVVGEWVIPTSPGQLDIDDVEPLFQQALFLQEQKRTDEAIALYTRIVELKPDFVSPYLNRALARFLVNDMDRALADYDKALAIDPHNVVAYSGRGSAYALNGDFARAIADFDQALEINPYFVFAYGGRSFAYAHSGDFALAIADYEQVLADDPDSAVALLLKRDLAAYLTMPDPRPRTCSDLHQVCDRGLCDPDQRGLLTYCEK